MIIDRIHLISQAGNGGNGCESLYHRRDKKTIPDGGDGGKGGSVVFRADTNAPTLANLKFRQRLLAESGSHGKSNKKRGRNGEDLIVLVPCGTRIYDRERNLLIRELLSPGEEVVVSEGGRGGSGNFGGKTATRGEAGKVYQIELTIRLAADVFLVGMPNSGKSKLMNVLTRVRAKEESYPFTTKDPGIGVWAYSDFESLTLCELPSLYRASHEGRGMGSEFLKHLERAKLILYMVAPCSKFAATIQEGFDVLRKEVSLHSKEFLKIPSAIVVNMMDLPEVKLQAETEGFRSEYPVFYVSVLTGDGMEKLKSFMKEQVQSNA